jgi:hypothetical protein
MYGGLVVTPHASARAARWSGGEQQGQFLALSGARRKMKRCQKRRGPGQVRRLTGTAWGRMIYDGGLIKRDCTLAGFYYVEVTVVFVN